MPGKYEGIGIQLLYPDNWKIDDEAVDSVTLESPGGAFISVNRFGHETTTETALQQAKLAMQKEYDEVEEEEHQREMAGLALTNLIQRFVYLDLIIESQLYAFSANASTYLIQIQGETDELEPLQPVFDAILTSLCQSVTSKPGNRIG